MKRVNSTLVICLFIFSSVFATHTNAFSGDFKKWKITIPDSQYDFYGSGSTTSAAELLPSACHSSGQDLTSSSVIVGSNGLTFFEVKNNRAHFRADMGGGVTTTNTNYIRSELRELFNVDYSSDNPCSTSSSNTSWFINDSATNTSTHTLSSILQVEEHPNPTVIDQLPKVVVGQVHGWEIKQALIKLQWEGDNKPVRAIINQDFFRDNISCSSDLADKTGCDKWSFSIELGTYPTGHEWRYDIVVDDSALYVMTRSVDGSNKVEHTLKWGQNYTDRNGNTIKLSKDWAGHDIAYYFKAGIYPQFKPVSKYTGEVFDVSFSQINLFHR